MHDLAANAAPPSRGAEAPLRAAADSDPDAVAYGHGANLADRLLDPGLRLQHALDLGYGYLGRRDRTTVEVRRHLEAKRVEPATVDEAVAELHAQGYLDDARYAQRF